jgi:hypothetical protein
LKENTALKRANEVRRQKQVSVPASMIKPQYQVVAGKEMGDEIWNAAGIRNKAKRKEEIRKAIPLTPLAQKAKNAAAKGNITKMSDAGVLIAPQVGTFKQAATQAKPVPIESRYELPPDGKSDLKGLKTDVQHREKMGDK